MWRRLLIPSFMVCATFFLQGCFPGGASAQDREPAYISPTGQPTGFHELATLFKHTAVPVQLYGIEGPDSLVVGEEGHFATVANIEAASLPLHVKWSFGDGTSARSLHARHRFTTPGTYLVTLGISNAYGEALESLFVTVLPSREEDPDADPLWETIPESRRR